MYDLNILLFLCVNYMLYKVTTDYIVQLLLAILITLCTITIAYIQENK